MLIWTRNDFSKTKSKDNQRDRHSRQGHRFVGSPGRHPIKKDRRIGNAFEEAQERQPLSSWFARHGRRPPGTFELFKEEISKALFGYHKEARAQEIVF